MPGQIKHAFGSCVLHGVFKVSDFPQPRHVLKASLKDGLKSIIGIYELDMERCKPPMSVLKKDRLFALDLGWNTEQKLLHLSHDVEYPDVPLQAFTDK